MDLTKYPTEPHQLWGMLKVDHSIEWTTDLGRRDDENWFTVWRDDKGCHAEAIQWYVPDGHFQVTITEIDMQQLVKVAEIAARLAM
jgi:hypothetical protein